jgi:DNA-binding MarR family transcriptional regulator
MIQNNVFTTLLTQGRSFSQVRGLVAKVLLEYAGDSTTERRQLTQRDIAVLAGTDWATVHASLRSLHDEGFIRIERHRIIINKELLQAVAGVAERIQDNGG